MATNVELIQFFETMIPFNQHLGMKVDHVEPGFVRLLLPFRPEFIGDPARPAMHGGVISTLVDTSGGLAVWSQLQYGDKVSTIDLRVDYLAHGLLEALYAEAKIVRVGNRVAVADVRCYQASDPSRTVATGKAVYNVKRKDD